MNPTPVTLAGAGLGLSVATWIAYLATIPGGKVPARPIVHILLQVAAVAASIAGIATSLRAGGTPSVLVIVLATFGLMVGGLFLWILTQRRTPIGDLRVRVGDKLLPFAATTSAGEAFHTDSFAGKRVLLKFFRGHW